MLCTRRTILNPDPLKMKQDFMVRKWEKTAASKVMKITKS